MKIKSLPEDFIVEEILGAVPQSRGAHHLYSVQKKNCNTADVVKHMADALNVLPQDVAYGGRKDKHALATQHISVFSKRPLPRQLDMRNFKIALIGFLDRPMGPDLIQENRFTLTIRGLSEKSAEGASGGIEQALAEGYPNYFDDQRFGSYDTRQGFLAEKILKKHENGALKIYLTREGTQDTRQERERKEKIYAAWGCWSACLAIAKTDLEKTAFRHLEKNPKDFRFLLRRIPRDELSGYFSAYQAYLWNEILRRFLAQRITGLKAVPGRLGDYLFYGKLLEAESVFLKNLVIPLPAGRLPQGPGAIRELAETVLAEQGLKSSQFNLKTIRQAFFKPVPRPAIVFPAACRHETFPDELNAGLRKCILAFTLPRGSFATMFVKRIFCGQA